jgi:hypothetical protein
MNKIINITMKIIASIILFATVLFAIYMAGWCLYTISTTLGWWVLIKFIASIFFGALAYFLTIYILFDIIKIKKKASGD